MRASVLPAVVSVALVLTMWPQGGRAQSDRDFVFTDQEGHLVLRFAGTGATGLNSSQAEEILNAEFSTMVHDRLQSRHWSLPEHRALLGTVQESLEAFVSAHPQDFEPVFLITAYDQETETPHIKAFLRRSGRALPPGP
jgi:hypothetical protein